MNSRKAARTIPATISRLLKSESFLKTPPASLAPLLSHPPPPSLIRSLPTRPREDVPSSTTRPSEYREAKQKLDQGKVLTPGDKSALARSQSNTKTPNRTPPRPPNTKHSKPLPIVFPEDQLRQQFFRDHPFEAYRPKDLNELDQVQGKERGPQGRDWTELRQRSIVPTAEDVIAFTLNLNVHHNIPLSQAYNHSISQFRTLRAEHEISTHAASSEARAHGATFFSEVERSLVAEEMALDEWKNFERIRDQINAGQKGRGANVVAPMGSSSLSSSEGMWATEKELKLDEEQQVQYELTGGEAYLQRFEERFLGDRPMHTLIEAEVETGPTSNAERSAT